MESTAQNAQDAAERTHVPHYRRRHQRDIPDDYNVFVLFGVTNTFGVAIMLGAGWQLEQLHLAELLALPFAFLFCNLVEYWLHRGPLHHKQEPLQSLFERHTRLHHDYFRYHNMAFTRRQECAAILFPYWAIGLVLLAVLVPYSFLLMISTPNVAHLFVIVAIAYYLLYEWLHLVYHLPDTYRITRWSLIEALRRHHQVHHHLKLMQRHNFNVTFPIFDRIFHTTYQPHKHHAEEPQEDEVADNS